MPSLRSKRRKRKPTANRFLEALEDRLLLTISFYSGGAADDFWETAANWTAGEVPVEAPEGSWNEASFFWGTAPSGLPGTVTLGEDHYFLRVRMTAAKNSTYLDMNGFRNCLPCFQLC